MEIQEVAITIDSSGKAMLETKGFRGELCLASLRAAIGALGGDVESQTLKPEYYDRPQDQAGEYLSHGTF